MIAIQQYMYLYDFLYVFLSLSLTTIFLIGIRTNKEKKFLTLVSWFSSLFVIISMYFSTFFYGILLDEYNMGNDYIILGLVIYSVVVFASHTIIVIVRKIKK